MIYVIEDDRGWEDYYRRVLRDYELMVFHDGVAAIAAMDEQVPDLVVLDILLTGPTGFAVLNEMQSYPELAAVPVVIVSSVGMPSEAASALAKYGIVKCLDKAEMRPQELLEAVRRGISGGVESSEDSVDGSGGSANG